MEPATFSDRFAGIAQAHPQRMAVEAPSVQWTWAQFVAQASRTARWLASEEVQPHDRIGIAARRNEEVLLLMVALWMLGATAVPLDFRTRAPERAALAADFGLAAILEDRPAGADAPYRSIRTDGDRAALVAAFDGAAMASPPGNAPALVALTSGTSGERLGALIPHHTLLARTRSPGALGKRDAGGRMLSLSPLSFSAAIHNTMTQLSHGGAVVFFPALFGIDEVAAALHSRGITSMYTVPTVIRGLLDMHRGAGAPAFPQLAYLYCSGAPLAAHEKQLALRVLSPRFVEMYASALAGRIAFLDSDDMTRHPESVGRVLPQVELAFVGADGKPVAAGGPGALRVRSPAMSQQVCGPAATRERGDRLVDGWVHTGDLARADADGFLYLLGRDSGLIIRGGENVYPAEIESAAMQMDGVREVAVFGVPGGALGEEIALFVAAGAGITVEALMAHLRARLVPNKTPRIVRMLGALPRNENGKVLFAELLRLAQLP
jgi:acyl-CoA synthetase (AMP-forming)/AMP-acid ligase II